MAPQIGNWPKRNKGLCWHLAGGVARCVARRGSERVAVPDPGALGVVEAVRQPLRLQQLQPVRAQVERLAAPAAQTASSHTQ